MGNQEFIQSILQSTETRAYDAYSAIASTLDGMTAEESGLPSLRIAVLRNFTVEPLLAILKAEVVRMGFFPCFYVGDHDAIAADVMHSDSAFYRFHPDIVIVAQWLETIAPTLVTRFPSLSEHAVTEETQRVVAMHGAFMASIRAHCTAPVLFNNYPLPEHAAFGILDAQREHMQVHVMQRLNQELLRRAREFSDVYVVDYAHLMARVGIQRGFDERYWHMGRSPLSRHALLPFGFEYVRFLRALKGNVHKCLILDCDNTLWGGVIGEDGIDGISLGSTYPGSCYLAFQREIVNLHDRGVILALCSKNNEQDVWEAMERHPYMVLRKHHFSAWQINWNDKAANIRRITEQLRIGMESVVFVDDSAYEIGLVRAQIPEATTLQLPAEASRLRAELCASGYFQALSLSEEDRRRNAMYREEEQRKQLRTQAPSLEAYLKQLQMRVRVGFVDPSFVPRIAQLTQKTNQFNVTTKRYAEGDIVRFMEDVEYDVFYAHLRDAIADSGVIGVAIVRYTQAAAEIDSFLLSCRALGRGVEDVLFARVVHRIRSKGCTVLRGRYLPTAKNGQVADFYPRRGFSPFDETRDGVFSEWEIDPARAVCAMPLWIQVEEDLQEKAYAPS